jgi:hypothetical protein
MAQFLAFGCRLPFRCELRNMRPPRHVTLLEYECGVLGSIEQSLLSLARGQRTHILLPERVLYGAWTQNLPLDSAHPCLTPDAPGMAAFNDYRGRPCPPRPDYLTHGRWGSDLRHCHHGWDQPSFCLQVGAAVSGARYGGIDRQTWPRLPAHSAQACPDGVTRGERVTRLGLSQRTRERVTK